MYLCTVHKKHAYIIFIAILRQVLRYVYVFDCAGFFKLRYLCRTIFNKENAVKKEWITSKWSHKLLQKCWGPLHCQKVSESWKYLTKLCFLQFGIYEKTALLCWKILFTFLLKTKNVNSMLWQKMVSVCEAVSYTVFELILMKTQT